MAKGARGLTFGLTNSRRSPWESLVLPVKRAAPMKGEPMTDENQEVANPWRAGCSETGTSGSEGGVGKRAEEQRALRLPYGMGH
jgi:hypothetical protein